LCHTARARPVDFEITDGYFSMTWAETIHTENSVKYGPREARVLLRAGGWSAFAEWEDQQELFSLILATAGPDPSTPCLYQQVDALQHHGKL
jgi:L-histidine Nalpha-methyltransferase